MVGTQTTNYLWDELSPYGDVVLETSNSGNILASYTLAGTELISQSRSGSTSYYLQDGQGSVRNLANAAGNITDTYSYTAFGELQSQTGSTSNHYLYTGQQFDDASGLYSLRARYYSPGVGRFLSQDTYAVNFNSPLELNRYGYTANNPVNAMDPSGHEMVGYSAGSYFAVKNNNAFAQAYVPFVLGLVVFAAVELLIAQHDVDAPTKTIIYEVYNYWKWMSNLPSGPKGPDWKKIVYTAISIIGIISLLVSPGAVQDTIEPTPTNEPRFVRVRHYDQQIDLIRSTMIIKSESGLAIWAEYPITTPYEEQAIQITTESFMRPLNGRGGFVEFNVDLNKWRMEPDPNLPWLSNAKIIWLWSPDDVTSTSWHK